MSRNVQLEGDLVSTPVEAVLQSLHEGRVTCTLWLEGNGFTKRLFLEDGRLLASASSDPREFLGTYLVDWGYLSADELDRLVELQDRYQALVGELLLRSGAVKKEDLERILQAVACEVALSAFLWSDGEYRVELCQLPSSALHPLALGLDDLIGEGLRRRTRVEEMREVAPNLRLRPRLERPKALELLEPRQAAILQLADGVLSIAELARSGREPVFVVWDTVAMAASQGVVDLLEPDQDTVDRPEAAFGTVRSLAIQVEQELVKGELRTAVATIQLLARRFRAAADIDIVVAALREKVEASVRRRVPREEMVLVLGRLDGQALADDDHQLERRLLGFADGRSSISQVVVAAGGDQLVVRATMADLIRREVLDVQAPTTAW